MKNSVRKTVFAALAAMTLFAIPTNSQTFNALGVGIAPPQGTLHIYTAQGCFHDQPMRDGITQYDYYKTLFRISNNYTGSGEADGFVTVQSDETITLRQFGDAPMYINAKNSIE